MESSSRRSTGPSEREIVAEFQAKRQRLQSVASKLQELRQELSEHEMVIKTLQPMAADRKCFRLVGDVLVERTVGETLPAVTKNKQSLEVAIKTLDEAYVTLEKQISEFQAKHQIRIVDQKGRPIDSPEETPSKPTSKAAQGVLVKQ